MNERFMVDSRTHKNAAVLKDRFKIDHSTVQVEQGSRRSAEMQL